MDCDERHRDAGCEPELVRRRGDVQQRQADQGRVLPVHNPRLEQWQLVGARRSPRTISTACFTGRFRPATASAARISSRNSTHITPRSSRPRRSWGLPSAANGGVGGPPVGAVHSGVFSPVVPRGGSPTFGTTPAAVQRRLAALKVRVGSKAHDVGTAVSAHGVGRQLKTRGLGNEVKTRNDSHPHGPLQS